MILIPLLRKIKIASHEKGSMSQPTKARHGATTNHHREAGIGIIPTSRRKDKEENMGYLSELTAHERLTVDNATLDMFTAFENGSDLIYDIWEQYFSDRERKNIESRDLEFIGRILYSVYDRMSNAIRDYHLMLGHYDAPGVQCFIDTAKRAQLTIDAVKASEHARNEMRTAAYDLDDADAIKLLTGKGASA